MVIVYKGLAGEQSVNLQGDDIKRFDLEITVKPSNSLFTTPSLTIITILLLLIVFLYVRTRQRQRD